MRQELDIHIIDSIKEYIIQRLNLKTHPEIINNLNSIKRLYVENLCETANARMQCRPSKQEIVIDKQFCLFDKNMKVTGLDPDAKQLIYTQIGHELLHIASHDEKNAYSGINCYSNDFNRGLNEGITQMITEDIFGYTLSPFTDSRTYQEFKKVAKIIKNTIGYNSILNSYFFHNNQIEEECNKLANDKYFFQKLNKELTGLYYLKKTASKNATEQVLIVLKERMKNIYYKLVVNIVIPKLKTLKEDEKKQFISNIIKDVSDNKIVEKEIISILKSTIHLSNNELEDLKVKLSNQTKLINEKQDFVEKLYQSPNEAMKKIYVDEVGNIKYLSNSGKNPEIQNEDMLTSIYLIMYKENKNYQLSSTTISTTIESIKNNEPITFNTKDIRKRKIWLSIIKQEAAKQGIFIITSYNELNTNLKIKVQHVNIKKGILSFDDLKTIAENFSVDLDNYNNLIVRDRKTNKIVNNSKINSYAIFANIWLDKASTNTMQNESIAGITSAFDDKNKKLYNALMSAMIKNIKQDGRLNLSELQNYFANNEQAIAVLSQLFKNQTMYQYIYSYMKNIEEAKSLVQNEKGYTELNDPNYEKNRIANVTNSILKR